MGRELVEGDLEISLGWMVGIRWRTASEVEKRGVLGTAPAGLALLERRQHLRVFESAAFIVVYSPSMSNTTTALPASARFTMVPDTVVLLPPPVVPRMPRCLNSTDFSRRRHLDGQ